MGVGASHKGVNIQILSHLRSAVDGKQGGGGGVSLRGEHLDT